MNTVIWSSRVPAVTCRACPVHHPSQLVLTMHKRKPPGQAATGTKRDYTQVGHFLGASEMRALSVVNRLGAALKATKQPTQGQCSHEKSTGVSTQFAAVVFSHRPANPERSPALGQPSRGTGDRRIRTIALVGGRHAVRAFFSGRYNIQNTKRVSAKPRGHTVDSGVSSLGTQAKPQPVRPCLSCQNRRGLFCNRRAWGCEKGAVRSPVLEHEELERVRARTVLVHQATKNTLAQHTTCWLLQHSDCAHAVTVRRGPSASSRWSTATPQ